MTQTNLRQQEICKNCLFLSLIVFFLLGIQENITAQRTCNTMELHEQNMTNPKYKARFLAKQAILKNSSIQDKALCSNPVILPMAVHYSGLGTLSAADKECLIGLAQNQIQILNDDYQGTNSDITKWSGSGGASSRFPGVNNGETCIQFCLAKYNHPSGYNLNDGDLAVTFNQVPGDSEAAWAGYINIFVKNISALGYSPLGGSGNGDGVAVDVAAFGSGSGCPAAGTGVAPAAPYNLGRTLTHELGHYLLLDHIWGGGCNSDDSIGDTPDASDPNYGCPATNQSSCNTLDLHMNYMDYTNDACMYMFSAGQSTVMENYTQNNLSHVIEKGASVCETVIVFEGSASGGIEGSSNCSEPLTNIVTVELKISAAPATPVTVNLSVDAASTATADEDYISFPTSVTFPAGSAASQTIEITILEDAKIENNEDLIIKIISSNNSEFPIGLNDTYTYTIQDDDNAPSLSQNIIVIDENFNGDAPGWTTEDGGSAGNTWTLASNYEGNDLDGTKFAFVDSDAAGRGSTSYETLLSPIFDSRKISNLTLSFDHYFRVYDVGYLEQINVDVFDGTTWQNVYNADGTTDVGSWNTPASESIDISAYANAAMQIRFILDAEWDYYWAVDNVKIEGIIAGEIQSDSNTNGGYAEHELGPNETIYFYDQATGNIMATIENLTNHDYGCTRLEIDNNGMTAYPSNDAAYGDLTDKNFKVTPQFNNSSGDYNITLYYLAEEINGWSNNNSREDSASELKMLKGDGSIRNANTLQSSTVTRTAFGADWAYTANFNTGFSGFALGNESGVLPISWKSIQARPAENKIYIDWTTSVETNNKGFEVQRKTTTGFESIGSVAANETGIYTFEDKNVRSGVTYYYQIVQEDFDGKSTASTIVSAKIEGDDIISIQPNPFDDKLFVVGNVKEAITVEIFNVVGKRVYYGQAAEQLDLSYLERGIYIVNLIGTNGITSSHKVVKR